MKGTEKQINWAEDIKAATAATIENILAMAASDRRATTPAAQAMCAKYARALDAVRACEVAGDLITVYGDVTKAKEGRDRMAAVAAKINPRLRFDMGYTAAQRALIGE